MSPALIVRGAWLIALLVNGAWRLAGPASPGQTVLLLATAGPLLLPLRGIWALRRRTLGWAPLTLSPAMAVALTELVANPGERWLAAAAAFSCFLALAGVVAALRQAARHGHGPSPGGSGER